MLWCFGSVESEKSPAGELCGQIVPAGISTEFFQVPLIFLTRCPLRLGGETVAIKHMTSPLSQSEYSPAHTLLWVSHDRGRPRRDPLTRLGCFLGAERESWNLFLFSDTRTSRQFCLFSKVPEPEVMTQIHLWFGGNKTCKHLGELRKKISQSHLLVQQPKIREVGPKVGSDCRFIIVVLRAVWLRDSKECPGSF